MCVRMTASESMVLPSVLFACAPLVPEVHTKSRPCPADLPVNRFQIVDKSIGSPNESKGCRQRGQIRAWYDFAYVTLRELEQAFCISQVGAAS
jgi:hypothetical protein